MAEEAERAVREFGPPVATPLAIRHPAIAANNFEIKPAMITMLQNSFALTQVQSAPQGTHSHPLSKSIKLENLTNKGIILIPIHTTPVQVGQLANVISGRNHGVLPSQPEVNPKNQEQAKAITLRKGKQVNTAVDLEKEAKKSAAELGHAFSPPITTTEKAKEEENSIPIPSLPLKPYVPQIPFPQRLRKNKIDGQFSKFLEMFRKLQINIPFAEALEQMPSYAKFMKDILSKKRKFGEHEKIQLIEECSAILQRKLPPKQKDRGSFKIPCTIGNNFFEKALCDLGSSINLLPLFVVKKIGIGEIKPTTVSLQMADRSITYPDEIIEDVLVKVDTLIFLITSHTLIDVEEGLLTLRVGNEKATFKVFEAIKFSREAEDCFRMELVDEIASDTFEKENLSHPLESTLVHAATSQDDNPMVAEYALYLDASQLYNPRRRNQFEPLGAAPPKAASSVIAAPTFTLKPFLTHLRYAYLGTSETLPVIIATNLSETKEEKVLRVLRKH
ncbi:uncharacterized protein LOC109948695 [Prunus persica]|uniref:uncharacterized protein LOC109948695 n=1 Tax=Prunus persica TaxID=3760 RepID=UPI0009AB8FBB|nr:uncharacterized protein LOC109948695 [Prunus persica]